MSIEEQFYLAWPSVARRLTRRGVAIFAACIWTFSIAARWAALEIGLPHQFLILGTVCRLDPIAAGLLLSSIGGAWRARSSIERLGLLVIGVSLWMIAGVWLFGASSPELLSEPAMIFAFALVSIACLALLIATLGTGGPVRNPLLVYLGRISYGLYVFHAAALIVARAIAPALVIPVGFALTIAVAAASYHWLESPFLRLKQRFENIPSRPV